MQELIFEPAWEKTLAPRDRERITEWFEATKDEGNGEIVFRPLSLAQNHEESLLVIVLIHNFTEADFPMEEIQLTLYDSDQEVAEYAFSFPHVNVPKTSSMPWTFIFPKGSWSAEPPLTQAQVKLSN